MKSKIAPTFGLSDFVIGCFHKFFLICEGFSISFAFRITEFDEIDFLFLSPSLDLPLAF